MDRACGFVFPPSHAKTKAGNLGTLIKFVTKPSGASRMPYFVELKRRGCTSLLRSWPKSSVIRDVRNPDFIFPACLGFNIQGYIGIKNKGKEADTTRSKKGVLIDLFTLFAYGIWSTVQNTQQLTTTEVCME